MFLSELSLVLIYYLAKREAVRKCRENSIKSAGVVENYRAIKQVLKLGQLGWSRLVIKWRENPARNGIADVISPFLGLLPLRVDFSSGCAINEYLESADKRR